MRELENKTAVVTGASRGIGRYIGRALAAEGVNLVLVARSGSDLQEAAEELAERGAKVKAVTCNLLDEDDRRNLPRRARAEFGQIDILVNNAGVDEIVPFDRQDAKSIRQMLELNLVAPLLLAREMVPYMLERGSGHIVNIASLAGRLGMPFGAVYAGTKSGLAEWSISLAAELEGTGVHVSVICPGFVSESGMFARRGIEAPKAMGSCKPEQVAAAVIQALRSQAPELLVNTRPVRPFMVLQALNRGVAHALGRRLGLIDFMKMLASEQMRNRARGQKSAEAGPSD